MKLSTKILAVAFVVAIALVVAIPASAATFTQNLTVGSTGAEVTQLQTVLGVTPVTGYFGPITKAAVVSYQASKGIVPTSGFVGPLTRASLNGAAPVTSTVAGCAAGAAFSSTTGAPCVGSTTLPAGCVAGAMFSSTTGASCSVTTPVVNNGVEGTIALTSSSIGTASTIYEGDSRVAILGLKLEAKNSNVTAQRVKIDLGTASAIYNKVLSRIYVLDGSNVLASSDLNSSTVVKETSPLSLTDHYYITLTGFNAVVAKDTTKILTIAVDVRPSVDSVERSDSRTIRTAAEAVRGVDGAGLNQYTVNTEGTVTKSFTISSTLADSAALKFSLNTASPKATTIIASSGALNNEQDKVVGLIFNVKAEKDNVLINEMTVNATGSAALAGQITTAYLFDGSQELDNTSTFTSTGNAVFSNVDLTVSKDSTKTLTVKFDIRNATTSSNAVVFSVDADTIDAENTVGDSLSTSYLSGSATGETLNIQKAGPVYTLVGTPSFTKTSIGNTASSTFLASFSVEVAAQGADVSVGATGAFVVGIYNNSGDLIASSSVGYEKPTSGVTGNGPYVIADGARAVFVPQVSFVAPNGVYTSGTIATARIMSITATTNSVASTATYIADTFRTGSQAF